jgi:hypothetical protein
LENISISDSCCLSQLSSKCPGTFTLRKDVKPFSKTLVSTHKTSRRHSPRPKSTSSLPWEPQISISGYSKSKHHAMNSNGRRGGKHPRVIKQRNMRQREISLTLRSYLFPRRNSSIFKVSRGLCGLQSHLGQVAEIKIPSFLRIELWPWYSGHYKQNVEVGNAEGPLCDNSPSLIVECVEVCEDSSVVKIFTYLWLVLHPRIPSVKTKKNIIISYLQLCCYVGCLYFAVLLWTFPVTRGGTNVPGTLEEYFWQRITELRVIHA